MKKLVALAVGIVVSFVSPAVRANCVDARTVSNNLFTYSICGVPDIDQRRAASADGTILGLPGDGAMYCVPTSAINWFAYLGSHVLYPLPMPGAQAQNWETSDPPVYNTMTMDLAKLGMEMGTDAVNGTGGNGAVAGMQQWIAENGASEAYMVSQAYALDDFNPTMAEMAKAALGGAYVMPVIGWYDNADTNDPKTRVGGHIVSLVGASGDLTSDTQTMVINDPNNNSDETTQSAFGTTTIVTQNVTNTFDGSVRTYSRTTGYGSGFVDAYFTIKFNWGLLYEVSIGKLVAVRPFVSPGDPVEQFFDAAGPVVDIAIHPLGTMHPYIVEGSNTIWQLDTLTGKSTRFATVGTPRAIEFGGADQRLYVLLKDHIISLDREGRQKDRVLLRDFVDQIAWDQHSSSLVALSLRSNKLLRFNGKLQLAGSISLPAVQLQGDGAPLMSVDPRNGMIWIMRRGAASALRVTRAIGDILPVDGAPGTVEVVPLDGVSNAESFAVGHNGLLYVSDSGHLMVFDSSGNRLRDSAFDGLAGGSAMAFARSFSNFDPKVQTGPGWRNVLPQE